MAGEYLIYTGIFVIIIGFIIIAISIIINTMKEYEKEEHNYYKTPDYQDQHHSENYNKPRTDVKGGGVVMIGPIPLVFGSDNQSLQKLMILAIILMLLGFAFTFVYSL
ncbi:Protein of unknown function DUF131 [Methanohalobium evestigatum Z-7303]|uniref:TIGR00304 family protein n=1 Tax=Methanohalobium evestigatum (strain ATCC BAA-1072 / DSM 3721 / NBRC 107634 / OCM 161 / Z-7303) TaxID=644295 RepID=D7E7Y5_METEZ|nr:TIGR00304 family protein [Methanohalobium evestigatum]ADI73327.1 Protein of unknown function DUF131 [Methanohalobium evestigatum Z-7303]